MPEASIAYDAKMSPAEATAKLAELTTAYKASQAPTGDSAQARLDKFTADPTIAAKLFSGDIDTNRRFQELTDAVAKSDGSDRLIDMIVSGTASEAPHMETLVNGQLSTRDQLTAIASFREAGLSDGAILEAMTGKPYDRATVARCKALQAKLFGDPEWTKRLMSGGHEERRQLTLMSTILANAA